jgi:hypothetical protein
MTAVADPSEPPGQETNVVVPVNAAGVFPTITFADDGHPFASVISTVYVPPGTFVTVCVVAPNVGQLNVKGADPFPGVAVTVPIPELQISGVEVALTVELTRVNHVVSFVIDPIPVPHAEPVKKYPVVPGGTALTFKTPLL